ncbi:hypothetical protein CRG98_035098 [Punica granatum]|uniref:Uncharacterized protein n=1 Tax=Punica granatum TaxID=22663 RepID=A0A2I0IKH7_PUNGR|nr:hypothetical protein CRG98_035098 [Punica granatum]
MWGGGGQDRGPTNRIQENSQFGNYSDSDGRSLNLEHQTPNWSCQHPLWSPTIPIEGMMAGIDTPPVGIERNQIWGFSLFRWVASIQATTPRMRSPVITEGASNSN